MEERKLTEYRSNGDLNGTKMLNGRTIDAPHEHVLEKMQRKSMVKSEKNLLYNNDANIRTSKMRYKE
jgi:hypothetical protein